MINLRALLIILASVGFSFAGEQIQSTKYFSFPNVLGDEVIRVEKVFNTESGKYYLKSNNSTVRTQADLNELMKAEQNFEQNKYGKITGDLRKEMIGDDRQPIKVLIAMKMPHVKHPNKETTSTTDLIAHSKAVANMQPVVSSTKIQKRYSIQATKATGRSMVATISRGKLKEMMFDQEIGSIEMYVEPKKLADHNFSVLASSAYNPGPVPANSASGINVATFEDGLWATIINCKNLVPAFVNQDNTGDTHTQQCFTALMNASPGANHHHRDSWTYSQQADQDWIIDNNIRGISRSMTNSVDPNTDEFRAMDDMAYQYPFPIFCNPAANGGYDLEVNWQCYNALSVGNVKHDNLNTYVLDGCTQTRNPDPVNGTCLNGGSSPCAGDRELPHIVAPGLHPNSTGSFTDNCLGNWLACGTSYSAPTANGISAIVRSRSNSSYFWDWPEAVRMAVMLTAHNCDGNYWNALEDGRDGAGAISGSDARTYAETVNRVDPGMTTGVVHGFYASSWNRTDNITKPFIIKVPSSKPAGKHLRVVLHWDSNPDLVNRTNTISDLDLIAFNSDSKYYHSSSYDSNVEMFDVPANELTAGQDYSFEVNPWRIDIPTDARTDYFYWAVGWTWVND